MLACGCRGRSFSVPAFALTLSDIYSQHIVLLLYRFTVSLASGKAEIRPLVLYCREQRSKCATAGCLALEEMMLSEKPALSLPPWQEKSCVCVQTRWLQFLSSHAQVSIIQLGICVSYGPGSFNPGGEIRLF